LVGLGSTRGGAFGPALSEVVHATKASPKAIKRTPVADLEIRMRRG
jgi:hypothetical protein